MRVDLFVFAARAEAVHADEGAFDADDGVPPLADAGLDGDADRGFADDAASRGLVAREEELEARHRHHARAMALRLEEVARLHRDLDLGARGEQADLRLAFGRRDLVSALGAEILLARL